MSLKLSLYYWRKHPAKLGIMVMILLSGMIALVLTLLLVRSSKMQMVDELLTIHGDYDFIVYDCKFETADEIASLDYLDGSGLYERFENVSVEGSYAVPAMAFRDDESERIFHMSMLRGHPPEKENQIALDLQYAKSCGIYPYPGETVSVNIDGDVRELELVGLYELKDDVVWGGFNRYFYIFAPGSYIPPQIMLDSSYFDPQSGNTFTPLCQKNDGETHELYLDVVRIGEAHGETAFDTRIDHGGRRGTAYEIAFETREMGAQKSFDETTDIVNSGGARKDVFAYIIPVFAVLIGIVTVISLYQLMKNVYEDRMHNSGIMLGIGMGKSARLAQLVLEPIIVMLILMPIGLLSGAGIFRLTVRLGGVQNALYAGDLIKQVTLDPWLTTIVIISAAVLAVSVMFVLRYRKATVLQLLDGRDAAGRHRSSRVRACRRRSWFGIIFGNISFTTTSVCLLIAIGMSGMTFGLVFSSEYGKFRAHETAWIIEQNNMANADYLAERQDNDTFLPNIENHHDRGVPPQVFEEFLQQNGSDISGTMACMVNSSGMLILEGDHDELPYSLSDYRLTPKPVRDNGDGVLSFDEANAYSTLAIWEATGYAAEDNVYSTPFVGLDESGFAMLEDMLADGHIDRTAIAGGEECILAVGQASYKSVSKLFHAGDEITLTDIIAFDTAETLDASQVTSADWEKYGELVYSDTITENDANVPATGYCMGRRHDIRVRIGGIVSVSSESDASFYLQTGKVNVFVAPETFEAWGLPDRNYTKVSVKLNEDAAVANIDRAWYGMLSRGSGMKSSSVAELLERYDREANGLKRIFIRIDVMLVLLIMIGIVLALYSRLGQLSVNVASLRAIGMQKSKLSLISLLQNELLVLVGGIASVIPVYGFYKISDFARRRIDGYSERAGEYVSRGDIPKHWTDAFLFEEYRVYELFSKEYIKEWLFVIAVFAVIAAAVSVLPIMSRSKLKITDDLKKE